MLECWISIIFLHIVRHYPLDLFFRLVFLNRLILFVGRIVVWKSSRQDGRGMEAGRQLRQEGLHSHRNHFRFLSMTEHTVRLHILDVFFTCNVIFFPSFPKHLSNHKHHLSILETSQLEHVVTKSPFSARPKDILVIVSPLATRCSRTMSSSIASSQRGRSRHELSATVIDV